MSVNQLPKGEEPAVSNTSADYWSDRYAGIIRGQWDHWQAQYQPLEQHFADLVLDPSKRTALRENSLGYVTDASERQYDNGLAQLERRDQRYGVGLSALEQQSRSRKMQATAQASKAKGLTDMTGYLDEREQQMMSGGVAYNPAKAMNKG